MGGLMDLVIYGMSSPKQWLANRQFSFKLDLAATSDPSRRQQMCESMNKWTKNYIKDNYYDFIHLSQTEINSLVNKFNNPNDFEIRYTVAYLQKDIIQKHIDIVSEYNDTFEKRSEKTK